MAFWAGVYETTSLLYEIEKSEIKREFGKN